MIAFVGVSAIWIVQFIGFIVSAILTENSIVVLVFFPSAVILTICLAWWYTYRDRADRRQMLRTLKQLRRGHGLETFVASFPSNEAMLRAASTTYRWLQQKVNDTAFPVSPDDPLGLIYRASYVGPDDAEEFDNEPVEAILQQIHGADLDLSNPSVIEAMNIPYETVAELVQIVGSVVIEPASSSLKG